MQTNPNWLEIAWKLQAIAQAGLTYCHNSYDIERYEELRNISIEILKINTGEDETIIRNLFASEKGYPTPKIDIRAAIFRNEKILMVKEKTDGRWSIPGGWADIGHSPFEIAEKEVKEESGLVVKAEKLLAVMDKKKHSHPPDLYHSYKFFILCNELDGELKPGTETLDARFYALNELPELSVERNTREQIELMFEYYRNPQKIVHCD